MATHLRVLRESFPMNTNMMGFRWFSKTLHPCTSDISSLSIGRVNFSCSQVLDVVLLMQYTSINDLVIKDRLAKYSQERMLVVFLYAWVKLHIFSKDISLIRRNVPKNIYRSVFESVLLRENNVMHPLVLSLWHFYLFSSQEGLNILVVNLLRTVFLKDLKKKYLMGT